MTWSRPLRDMIEEDLREAARLKGAKSRDEVKTVIVVPDVPARQTNQRRRIVVPRSAA